MSGIPRIAYLPGEAIALPVGGEDVDGMLGVALELLAQAQDVIVHGARGGKLLVAPHFLEKP